VGACASTLVIVWCFLLVLTVIDAHLTLRGAGDLVFVLLAIVSGRISMTNVAPYPRRAAAGVDGGSPTAVAQRIADICLSAVGLVVLGLPMLIIAMAIRLDGGPALFGQRRVGLHGSPFTMYKFRSMRPGGDDRAHRELIARELRGEDTTVDGSSKLNDERVTKVGRWLRKTSLDELPQLVNVLRGDMSLVGPRPCLEWEAEMFPARFAERFTVPPGITGLWQVSGRSTLETLDMLQLDLDYVRSRSMRIYVRILVGTVAALYRGDGAR
jgi:lipopolysaccharide/colanic/teichoic acid biosynthesis glycosyltransferase